MKVYINQNNEIKAVNTASDASLLELDILDEFNPFAEWSEEKICCYKVNVKDGRVVMMTPYVDSKLIEHFDIGGRLHTDNSEALFDLADLAGSNSEAIYDLAECMSDLEARLNVLEEGGNK